MTRDESLRRRKAGGRTIQRNGGTVKYILRFKSTKPGKDRPDCNKFDSEEG